MAAKIKTILILGGGTMQIPAIRIAKRKGWRVIVADGCQEAEGAAMADYFEQVDIKDRDKMVCMAKKYMKKGRLNGVFTAGTDFSTTVAWVAQQCGLPGIPYKVALCATNKIMMRQTLKDSDVPCPKYIEFSKQDNPEIVIKKMSFPLVVKPIDNMGSRGVCKAEDFISLKKAISRAYKASRSSRIIIESYIEGKELSIDAIVYKGKITICGIADRHISFAPYFVEMGHTMPSSLDDFIIKEASEVFKKGIKALGIDNGAAKGDIIISSDRAVIGEIAARLSGGYMSGWTYPYSSGIEITEAAMNMAVGLPPGNLKPLRSDISAERAFISIPGKISEITGIESTGMGKKEVEQRKCIMNMFLRVGCGQDVVFPTNNMQKCGNIITRSSNRKEAITAAENGIKRLFVHLKADNPVTDRFLFKEVSKEEGCRQRHSLSPAAFKLTLKENRIALSAMPAFKQGNSEPAVLALPAIKKERSSDWHGMSFVEALDKVMCLTRIDFANQDCRGRFIIGSLFWKAFLKGGVQGGVYIIDTIKEIIRKDKSLIKYRWGGIGEKWDLD